MAVEEREQKTEESPKKGGMIKWLIIAFILLILLIGTAIGGIVLYKKVLAPSLGLPPLFENYTTQSETVDKKEKKTLGVMFSMPSFVVNLAKSGGERFIKVTIQMEMSDGDLKEELSGRLPQIQDNIITVLSSTTLKGAITAEGKIKLKEEMMSRTNLLLVSGSIKNIYFTEFVIQ